MRPIFPVIYKTTSAFLLLSMVFPFFAVGRAENRPDGLNDEQKILHVLNRLGFGPRRGDVEKVKAMGLTQYIERQLNPPSEDSPDVAARLSEYEVLNMETSAIFARYPNPGALLRRLNGNRRGAASDAVQNERTEMNAAESDRRERQRIITKYYRENDLRPANQIIPQMQMARIIRAVYSENQLQEQMVDFWMNHFNVYAGKAAVRWYIPSYERDVIRRHALGNFKDLVRETARHPAMLFYLDNFQSVSPEALARNANGRNGILQRAVRRGTLTPRQRERLRARGLSDEEIDRRLERAGQVLNNQSRRGINENYARELMELHTLGVEGGYTQQDIVEVAKAFTGWTIADPRGYRTAADGEKNGAANSRPARRQRPGVVPAGFGSGEFYFNERWHAPGVKTVLGQKIDEGGIRDGLKVIDILVAHPSTARFIARKLAVKFVCDDPDEKLVARVAEAFRKSGGDIKTTLRALFNTPEFYAPENYRAKIKTPFELLVSSLRALDADVRTSPALLGLLRKMGEPLYGFQAPTGYPDTAEDWVNTGALLERMNFAVALASGRIPNVKINLAKFKANSGEEILNKVIGEILFNEISAGTKSTLLKQIKQSLPEAKLADETGVRGPLRRTGLPGPNGDPEVFKAVGLILGSPEFQRQ